MAIGEALQKQAIEESLTGQCTAINVTCYEEDGVTLRDMTTGAYKLAWSAVGGGVTISKTSDAGQIDFGVPDNNSVQVKLEESDTNFSSSVNLNWELRGTDTDGNCEFVAAYGQWMVKKWV